MERTLTAFSAVVLLIGCCTACGGGKKPLTVLPPILFIYSRSGGDSCITQFIDCMGDQYAVISERARLLGVAGLAERYSAGELADDIRLVKSRGRAETEKVYALFIKASADHGGHTGTAEQYGAAAPQMRWSGICYDGKGKLVMAELHDGSFTDSADMGN